MRCIPYSHSPILVLVWQSVEIMCRDASHWAVHWTSSIVGKAGTIVQNLLSQSSLSVQFLCSWSDSIPHIKCAVLNMLLCCFLTRWPSYLIILMAPKWNWWLSSCTSAGNKDQKGVFSHVVLLYKIIVKKKRKSVVKKGIQRVYLQIKACESWALRPLCVILASVFCFVVVCKTFLELEHQISPKSTYACKWGKAQRVFTQKPFMKDK